MPNAVLTVNKHISEICDIDFFVSKKGIYLYPVDLEKEAFFLKLIQNDKRLVIKLDKSTMPKITSSLKDFMLRFAEDLALKLNGNIEHHNLNINRKTDYSLFDNYEIKTQAINKTSWVNELCNKDRLNLEIGMGSGEFLTNEAKTRKNECFIGVEVLNNDFYIALRRFNNAKLDNIKAVYYDARAILDKFESNSIDNIYLNFPEPWFRAKRLKHSILTARVAKKIERILKVGGRFNILTDNHPFALSSCVMLENSTKLKSLFNRPYIITNENIKTKYEKKWIKYQRTIYKLVYTKDKKSEPIKPISLRFPIKIKNLNSLVKDGYVFKVLGLYKNTKGQQIVELTLGYGKNPQHIFFSFKDGYIDILPQSNFIVNHDFLNALAING